jgi:hypothetical protein
MLREMLIGQNSLHLSGSTAAPWLEESHLPFVAVGLIGCGSTKNKRSLIALAR